MIVVVKVKDISLVVWALGGEMFLEQCMRRSSQELLVVSCESVLEVMLLGNVVRSHRVIIQISHIQASESEINYGFRV